MDERRLCLRPISVEILLLGSSAYHLEFLVFVEIEQVDLAKGVEIVARAWENSIDGVLDLDAGHEGAPSFAPPALRWAPGGAVVPPPLAVGALPEGRVPDRNGPQVSYPAPSYRQLCW